MAGRVNTEDIDEVRSRARIDDVVSSYVALKPAGGGSLKGLCPFHDEKTPSFQVTPSRGFFYCFGCGKGGDVVTFMQEIANLSFREAIEQLADRYGVQLRFEDGGGAQLPHGGRLRILEANAAAAEFFSEQLLTPEAVIGRQFLAGRGFSRADAEKFGIGFAPTGGRSLASHLRGRSFTDDELIAAGLIRTGGWDFFQGRLIWPIRDAGHATLGFGARRLFDDDRMPAKYLNTPETSVYKKSHVLYGLDLARAAIGRTSQAVIVEGYTDVMAAHLAGVETAVASCGTAFGDDHARLIQRLIGGDAFRGEVIFTFDGDEAGQKAALKVFSGDQNFIAQTYVAVEPSGLDPCDLRIASGDAALRELVARRVPLYTFVMRNVLDRYDLDRVDGRLAALRAAAPLISSIRDASLVSGYVRDLATMLGSDVDEVRAEVAAAGRRRGRPIQVSGPQPDARADVDPDSLLRFDLPDPTDRSLVVERDTCKLIVQRPDLFAGLERPWREVCQENFTHPAYRAVFAAAEGLDPSSMSDTEWSRALLDAVDAELRPVVVQLSVEPLTVSADARYADEYCAKLRLLSINRVTADLKSQLQRMNPIEHPSEHRQMFASMVKLESLRRQLLLVTTGDD